MKQIFLSMLKEIPGDTIVAQYISSSYTANEMMLLIEKGDDIAKQWTTDLLRACIDLIKYRSQEKIRTNLLEVAKKIQQIKQKQTCARCGCTSTSDLTPQIVFREESEVKNMPGHFDTDLVCSLCRGLERCNH